MKYLICMTDHKTIVEESNRKLRIFADNPLTLMELTKMMNIEELKSNSINEATIYQSIKKIDENPEYKYLGRFTFEWISIENLKVYNNKK